ncbi:MAG: hypothetical protein AAB320_04525 [Elusimicrobiota bacterium]
MFDFLWSDGTCPLCRCRAARLAPWGDRVRCRNSSCKNADMELQRQPMPPLPPPAQAPLTGDFQPGTGGVTIKYVNRDGEEKAFDAERSSLKQKGEHITARVAPTGKRIALATKWIRNLSDVQGLLARSAKTEDALGALTSVERQLLGYHRKRKSTSPRYEALLKKYPDLAGK